MRTVSICILLCVSAWASPANKFKFGTPLDAHGRILGGRNATLGEAPYQISYQYRWGGDWQHLCGGSLISPTWIVSAAHCISLGPIAASFRASVGTINLNDASEDRQDIKIVERIIHPDYDVEGTATPNDIALFRLETAVNLTEFANIVSLPEAGADFTGTVVVSGWGSLDEYGHYYPDGLQIIEQELITVEECQRDIDSLYPSGGSPTVDVDSNICLAPANLEGVCSGDSGGPIVQSNFLVGLVSWGFSPCGGQNTPSVPTRVSNFIEFIESHVEDLPK